MAARAAARKKPAPDTQASQPPAIKAAVSSMPFGRRSRTGRGRFLRPELDCRHRHKKGPACCMAMAVAECFFAPVRRGTKIVEDTRCGTPSTSGTIRSIQSGKFSDRVSATSTEIVKMTARRFVRLRKMRSKSLTRSVTARMRPRSRSMRAASTRTGTPAVASRNDRGKLLRRPTGAGGASRSSACSGKAPGYPCRAANGRFSSIAIPLA